MFLILGLTWAFDIIAFALQPYQQSYIGIEILVVVFLVVNSSHGIIFFFVIFFNADNVTTIRKTSNYVGRRISTFASRSSTRNSTRTTTIELEPLNSAKLRSTTRRSTCTTNTALDPLNTLKQN